MPTARLREWKAPRQWPHRPRFHRRHRRGRQWARRPSRQRTLLLKPVVVAAAVLGVAFALGALLLFRDLSRVRDDLSTARDTLRAAAGDPGLLVTNEGRAETRTRIEAAVASIEGARRRTLGSPAISIAGGLPLLRAQRSGLLELIDDSATASSAGRDLLVGLDALADRTTIRNGTVPLDGLRRLQADLTAASSTLEGLARSASGLWGPLGGARRQFDEAVRSTSDRISDGAAALGAALPFMGADGQRTYLVAAQNNAEMRDQGMVLSYAVVRFAHGRLFLDRNGSIGELALSSPAPTKIPAGTAAVFGFLSPTVLWHSVNATADFSWSGRAMADMFLEATGERVDGVIAIDVPALARLLAVTGPVTVRGLREQVTSQNAARVLLHDLYEGLPPSSDQGPRRELLSEVTKGVVQAVTSGQHDAVAFGRQLGEAAAGGHLRIWSASAGEEEVFARIGLGGGPGEIAPDRTFHVAVQNRTATKLDYYVKTSVRQVVDLTRQGDAIVRTTVVIENRAPADGKPSYQLGPDKYTSRPGEYRAAVFLWAPVGSQKPPGPIEESGLSLTQHVLVVDPGQRVEVPFRDAVIKNAVRDGRLELRLVPQPRLEPAHLEIRLNAPHWRVASDPVWSGPWDRTVTAVWRIGG